MLRRVRSARTAATVTVLLVAVTSGCSGDEVPDEEPPAGVRDGLAALFAGDHPGPEEQVQATCFARELTDRVSTDRLREAELVDDRDLVVGQLPTLPDDLAADWVDAQLACVDFVEASTLAQEKVSKGALDGPAYAACLGDALPGDEVRDALVAGLTGEFDDPAVTALAEAQDTCARAAAGD